MAKLIKITQLHLTQQEGVFEQGSATWINADRIFRVDLEAFDVEDIGTAQGSVITFDNGVAPLLVLETPEELSILIDGIAAEDQV